MGLRAANRGLPWTQFDPKLEPDNEVVRLNKFLQYEFFRQWSAVKAQCERRNISIMGDMPFYVEHDSADVWQSPGLFDLDRKGQSRTVGGVPPDYFSEDGQLWGNPTYRWKAMEETGYKWWVKRFQAAFEMVHLLRVDHFRGFVKYWSVPASHSTARNGKWRRGPAEKLFAAVRKKIGDLPLVAENLGLITPAVEKLRTDLGLPGMVVLQFGFGEDGTHRPNNYVPELVCFTGTHDNNTTRGWWDELTKAAKADPHCSQRLELERAKSYLETNGRDVPRRLIEAVMTSVANVCVLPMQDVLGLGSSARMNVPGRAKGNWDWRYEEKMLTPGITSRLRKLTEKSGR